MVHGKDDVTCCADTAKAALDQMLSIDKTWVLLDNAKHDLEFDYVKDEWHKTVLHWLESHVELWHLGAKDGNLQ
jgi:esterase/lipase